MSILMKLAASGKEMGVTYVSSSVASANSTSVSVSVPSGVANGDLLVAFIASGSGVVYVAPPSGWTMAYYDNGAAHFVGVCYKIANNESGSYVFTNNTSAITRVNIVVYRNANTINVQGAVNRSTSATVTATTVTPSKLGTLVWYASTGSATTTVSTAPSGFTQRSFEQGLLSTGMVYDKANNPASATGSISATIDASVSFNALLVQITNEVDNISIINTASTQLTSNSTTITINVPTNTANGDLMLAIINGGGGSINTVTCSGWTVAANLAQRPIGSLLYRTASSEPANYTFTASNSRSLSGCIITVRNVNYSTISATSNTNQLVIPSITSTAANAYLFGVIGRDAASLADPGIVGMTYLFNDADATAPSWSVYYSRVPSGPTGVRFATYGTGTNVAAFSFLINPA